MQSSTLSRRERKRQAQKAHYLSAAGRLFGEKGFENTSIEDISEAVDMGVGSFYYYFLNKEDLVANMLLQGVRELKGQYQEAYDNGSSLRESVEMCSRKYLDFHEIYGPYLDIVSAVRQGHKKANIDEKTMEIIYREIWDCVVIFKKIYEKHGTPSHWQGINIEYISLASWALIIGVGYFKQQLLSSFPHLNIDMILETALDMVQGRDTPH